MMRLKIFTLLLLALVLPLSFGNLNANAESAKQEISPSLSKDHNSSLGEKPTASSPAQDLGPVQGSSNTVGEGNQANAREIEQNWRSYGNHIYCWLKSELNWGSIPDWLLVFAAIATARYALLAFKAAQKQANAAEKTLQNSITPRLHVETVWAADFKVGEQPIFFVKIVNSGLVLAADVAITIRVESDKNYLGAKYTHGPNAFSVPANGSREYFIRVSERLTQDVLDGFNKHNWRLVVRGDFKYQDELATYCYKYYPYDGSRPAGLPQFIPCDMDIRLTGLKTVTDTLNLSAQLTADKIPPN